NNVSFIITIKPSTRNITSRPSDWHITQSSNNVQDELPGTDGGDSCGNSMSLETPQEVNFFRGGSSHARGKRPPVVKGNGVTLSALLRKLIIINRQIFMPKHIIRGDVSMIKSMPKREDVNKEETWNLKDLFETEEDYEQALDNLKKTVDNFVKRYKNQITNA